MLLSHKNIIESLSLRSTNLCSEGVRLLAKALAEADNTALVDLDLSENPKIGDAGEG